jgi:hypothetical protein
MRLETIAGIRKKVLHLKVPEIVYCRGLSPYEPYSPLDYPEMHSSSKEISTSNPDNGAVLPIQTRCSELDRIPSCKHADLPWQYV